MPRLAARKRNLTVAPRAEEADELQSLAGLLRKGRGRSSARRAYVTVGDREAVLPDAAAELLRALVDALAAGEQLTITRTKMELTTTEAASLLNVSRQYLVRLCDEGKLPFRWEGTHRRLTLDAVLTYRDQRDKERDAKFANLVRRSAEAGEYDIPITWPPQE